MAQTGHASVEGKGNSDSQSAHTQAVAASAPHTKQVCGSSVFAMLRRNSENDGNEFDSFSPDDGSCATAQA